MIRNLYLKFGKNQKQSEETINLSTVTVFVGPNSSGKSTILKEILNFCNTGSVDKNAKILKSIEFEDLDEERVTQLIDGCTLVPPPNQTLAPGFILVGKPNNYTEINKFECIKRLATPNLNPEEFCECLLQCYTLFLDGISRIQLINQQKSGDLQLDPVNTLQTLFKYNEKRNKVREIVHDSFGGYLVVDPTNMGYLSYRLSNTAPSSERQERGWHDDAVKFHKDALPAGEWGDGVKAFVGIISEIVAGDPLVVLIDEPEAFLHPALAFNLGKEVAKASYTTDKRVIVSTHSPNFVMGCIQSGVSVTIVRLTHNRDESTARILNNQDLLPLMRNPLLRSTSMLNGIFFEFVVVTEGDSDRAFYQEINERLLQNKPEWGIPNCLFLNAQNKQTVSTLLTPLRNLGIPAATIVDLDVLKEGGQVWSKFVMGGFVPNIDRQAFATLRESIHKKIDKNNGYGNGGGINVLNDSDKESAENLCNYLADYGLFLVKSGELESWLPELRVSGRKPKWLIEIFKNMGEDSNSSSYLQPKGDGVWSFVRCIRSWLVNPNRKGIPY